MIIGDTLYEVEMDVRRLKNGNLSSHVSIGMPEGCDGQIKYRCSCKEYPRQVSTGFDQYQPSLSTTHRRVTAVRNLERDESFEYDTDGSVKITGKHSKEISTTSTIFWVGNVGYLFIANRNPASLSLYPRYREFTREGEYVISDVNYYHPHYGSRLNMTRGLIDSKYHFFDYAGFGLPDRDLEVELHTSRVLEILIVDEGRSAA